QPLRRRHAGPDERQGGLERQIRRRAVLPHALARLVLPETARHESSEGPRERPGRADSKPLDDVQQETNAPHQQGASRREAEMNLLLIHGIAQGGKNPKDLERAWLEALAKGLKKSKLTMPGYVNVLFPYYADQLDKFVAQFDMPTGNQVTAKGGAMDNDYAQFRAQMAEDMRKQAKIPVEQVKQEAGPAEIGRASC